MPKRSDTLETVRIILELLQRIPRNRKISAAELHTELSEAGMARDKRTIQRHLEFLIANFDIECDDRSSPYGYRWAANAKALTLPGLTDQQALLLSLAEQYLRNLLPASLMKSMTDFFAQARGKINDQVHQKRASEWLSKVRVVSETQPLLPPKIRPGVFDEVSNALYANRWLEVDYQNADGKRAVNEVMPLGLAQQGPRLYLVCRFQNYDDERSLALHRIHRARALSHAFERPKDFELKIYDEDGRFGFGEGERITVTFRIDKLAGRHLLETPLSADQKVVELKNTYKITATVVDSDVFWRWVRGFGELLILNE